MSAQTTIAGVLIPSTAPLFLAGVAVHVAAALACLVAGAGAMLSRKGGDRHATFGTVYHLGLLVVCVTALALAASRWAEDYPLAILATAAFAAAETGRRAAGRRRLRPHLAGMGASYVLMLTAFYVDNGRVLPLWRDLHPAAYWLVPAAIGVPVIAWVLARHPMARLRGQEL